MILSPDYTQAGWELGSACFGLLNIRAVRRSKSIAGVHWAPTAFFAAWGLYNLWFYSALHLPVSWWAGIAITVVNLTWLGHLAYYGIASRHHGAGYKLGFNAGYKTGMGDGLAIAKTAVEANAS